MSDNDTKRVAFEHFAQTPDCLYRVEVSRKRPFGSGRILLVRYLDRAGYEHLKRRVLEPESVLQIEGAECYVRDLSEASN